MFTWSNWTVIEYMSYAFQRADRRGAFFTRNEEREDFFGYDEVEEAFLKTPSEELRMAMINIADAEMINLIVKILKERECAG